MSPSAAADNHPGSSSDPYGGRERRPALAMPMNITLPDLRWGLVAPSPGSVCLHCGRPGAMHAGACWDEPRARRSDRAHVS